MNFALIFLALLIGGSSAIKFLESPKLEGKLALSLLTKDKVSIFIRMPTDTSEALQEAQNTLNLLGHSTHEVKTTTVYKNLLNHAKNSQNVVLEKLALNFPTLEVESFWISNQIYIRNANTNIVEFLIELDDVEFIEEEQKFHLEYEINRDTLELERKQGLLAEWGIEQMKVPQVWEMGFRGEGIRIGNIDTGVRHTHESIVSKWLGLADYGWYDPENKTSVPHDVYNHGTGSMGILVGDYGIGAAPSAKWMACKGYRDDGSGLTSTFIACGQYMLCPTDYLGNNANCSKAPHVVSNSWGLWGGSTAFNHVIDAWISAGILSSFSAGNTRTDGCQSIYSPADNLKAIAVGATSSNGALAWFSSLGPSPFGGMKPEISGPGVDTRSASSTSDTSYTLFGGTSGSCPHVSGVLALLKNIDGNLEHFGAKEVLQGSAMQFSPTTGESCGGISDTQYPNNHIGWGIVDAHAASQMVQNK